MAVPVVPQGGPEDPVLRPPWRSVPLALLRPLNHEATQMRRPSPLFALSPFLLALLACPSPSPDPAPIVPALELRGADHLSLQAGSTASIDLVLGRNATATDPVTLSAEGLPDGVTAGFTPETLAGAVQRSTVHLQASHAAPSGTFVVTFRAKGSDTLSATKVVSLEVLASDPEPLPPELTLHGPDAAIVHPGSATALTFTLERNETAVGEVTFSLTGLPEGLAAHFEPASLTGDASETTLHLEAEREAAVETVSLTLHATGPDALVVTHALSLDIQTLTVTGRVQSQILGLPPEPLQVRLGAEEVLTDEEGTFTFHDVRLPYDLVVIGPNVTEHFLGLTSTEPRIIGIHLQPRELPTVATTLHGSVSPAPVAGETIIVCVESTPQAWATACAPATVNEETSSFEVGVELIDTTSAEVRVVARRFLTVDGELVGFTGEALAEVSIREGAAPALELILVPSASTPVDVGLGEALIGVSLTSFGDQLALQQSHDPLSTVHVPENGSAYVVAMSASATWDGHGMTMRPVTGPLDAPIEIPAPLSQLSPAEGEPLTADTTYITEAPQRGVATHVFEGVSDGNWRSYVVHTTRDRVNLSEIDAGIDPTHIQIWGIFHEPTSANVDALVETGDTALKRYLAIVVGAPVPVTDLEQALSVNQGRSFNQPVRVRMGPASVSDASTRSLLGLPFVD